ncbi:MAG: ATPase, T2SS/T4P/T4SS family [Planctomycetota bacterium]|jgi:pilus assembly protein CpaF|nr:ATPase, T2SS/T4P/T4SS family [Planctomycetota bacterium]
MYSLIVTDLVSAKRKRLKLSKTPFKVGRKKDNDLILPHESVSSHHCQITMDGESVHVMDLDSTGGTLLNESKVDDLKLFSAGDKVLVGKFKLELLEESGSQSESHESLEEEHPFPETVSDSSARKGTVITRELRRRIHGKLQNHPELVKLDFSSTAFEIIRARTKEIINQLLSDEIASDFQDDALVAELLDEALGYGPLEIFLEDESVDEVMINNFDTIFIERKGRITQTDKSFTDVDQLMNIIRRILAPIGRRIDESSPMVDARLPDGSRVNAIIPPLSLIGPVVTIRKFPSKRFDIHELIQRDSLTENMAVFLRLAVQYRRNILVSGGTGSGKTTLLNVLSSFIPNEERIVSIEDAAELRLHQPHVIPLEAKPANIEGDGAIPVRKLLVNSLRMRPDRIIIGECRGGEALDMLQAMNTGHDGSLTTLHANSARDALNRLETLVLMAGMDLPVKAIRDQIASAVHIIIHQARMPDGTRKIISISELTGQEGDAIVMQDLFSFESSGQDADGVISGMYRATGAVPKFVHELRSRNVPVDLGLFNE